MQQQFKIQDATLNDLRELVEATSDWDGNTPVFVEDEGSEPGSETVENYSLHVIQDLS